jgi:hypothetical protein
MKKLVLLASLTFGILSTHTSFAQTAPASPATKPADATGQCRDGSYSTDAAKSGACRGHHGVKEWYAAATPASPTTSDVTPAAPSTTPAVPAHTGAPSPTTQVRTQSAAAAQAAGQSETPPATQSISKGPVAAAAVTPVAPGAAPGLVWLNTGGKSKVYHCPGTTFYGKTKHGEYMTEADAKAKGAHGVRNQPCTK